MGHSSLVGTDKAPRRAKGRDEQSLGPSDTSDSGSDAQGADALPTADPGEPVDVTLNRDQAIAPIEGTSEESHETEATDIATDRVIDSTLDEDLPLDDDVESSEGNVRLPARRGAPAKPS